MVRRIKLTIPGILGTLLLAGCAGEASPPPETYAGPEDPRAHPVVEAPAQPTGPQPWSRDLDFETGPAKIERGQLTEGLVPTEAAGGYSGQRLTYQSAFEEDRTLTPAEQVRQRALERAKAAGLPPPPAVAPPPLESVSSEPLPAAGGGQANQTAARRESRLPPPPKFPPMPSKSAEAATLASVEPAVSSEPPQEATAAAAPVAGESQTASFVADAWNAPSGTVLVQVSAVPDGTKVMSEWHRLQKRYPEVLQPLRLVVQEATLGERGVFYRVQAGAFADEAGASQACDTLISQGQSCFVVVR